MNHYIIPYFGTIDLNNLEEEYYTEVSILDYTITIDINFKKTSISTMVADKITHLLQNIVTQDQKNKVFLEENYKDKTDETYKYIQEHFDLLGEDFFNAIGVDRTSENRSMEFLSKMKLIRIGLYPDRKYDSMHFAIFDYTTDREYTNQLLVINTDADGNIDYVSWES